MLPHTSGACPECYQPTTGASPECCQPAAGAVRGDDDLHVHGRYSRTKHLRAARGVETTCCALHRSVHHTHHHSAAPVARVLPSIQHGHQMGQTGK